MINVLLDIQALQTEGSKDRGIGRYAKELTKHIMQNMQDDNIKLYLNSAYKEHDNLIKNYFQDTIPSDKFIKYDILDLSNKTTPQRAKYTKINSLLIKKQLNEIEEVDILHIHSIFENQTGKACVVSDFSNIKAKVVVSLYDLIPMLFSDIYLSDDNARDLYYKALRLLYEADLILAISEATKEDAINLLGIPADHIVNISGAIDSTKFFKIEDTARQKHEETLKKHNITQPFIMYTGGIDFRKNIDLAIKAFSKIEPSLFDTHQFVIVCKISNTQKNNFTTLIKKLSIPNNKIIFTGFISDTDLNILYNEAKLFIFPSIYEGFGLPILEAMSCGTAVIASNTSSMPEILDKQECLFDPLNTEEITAKINTYLSDESLLKELQKHSFYRSKKFTWDNSAKKTIDCYKSLQKREKISTKKEKIAFFSPLPNMRSGISDYSLDLLPFLSKYVDIDIFIDDYTVSDPYINANYNIYDYRAFQKVAHTYDNVIYQFGNSSYHAYMYDIAIKYPGIIVLHDFYLSGLINYIATTTKNIDFLFEQITYSHKDIASRYKNGILNKTISIEETLKDLPINKKIIDSAKSIILHSNHAKTLFDKFYADQYDITIIKQLVKTPSLKRIRDKSRSKEKLKLKSDATIISAFGHIADRKQYHFILECLVEANIFKEYNIKLLFIGEYAQAEYEKQITSYINQHNLQDSVTITGFVEDELYKEYLIASDIGINLRIDSRGETSRALLMNMAYALPTIINDHASFCELPDNATIKVKPKEKEEFIKNIKKLLDDETYRKTIATNAYNYILKEHNIDNIAKKYHAVIAKHSKTRDKTTDIEAISDTIIAQGLENELTDEEFTKIETILRGQQKQ